MRTCAHCGWRDAVKVDEDDGKPVCAWCQCAGSVPRIQENTRVTPAQHQRMLDYIWARGGASSIELSEEFRIEVRKSVLDWIWRMLKRGTLTADRSSRPIRYSVRAA